MKAEQAVLRVTLIAGVMFSGLAAYTGCGPARRGAAVDRPVNLTQEGQAGQLVFMEHCNKCHPGGAGGLGPALNNKPVPAFAIKTQVRNGFGAMPAFTEHHLSDKELDHLVTYLKELRRADAEE